MNDKPKQTEYSKLIGDTISNFVKTVQSQNETFPLVMQLITTKFISEFKHYDAFIKANNIIGEVSELPEGDYDIALNAKSIKEFDRLYEEVSVTSIAQELLPVNYMISFVCQYDSYLSSLIKALFIIHPEILNSSEKSMSFSELMSFQTLDEVKAYLIEKEVEAVMRTSHNDQIKWLERKLKIPLTKDLPNYKEFIEITERRNLFVHSNGIVSSQYIKTCKTFGANTEQIEVGDKLIVTPDYIEKCYKVIFEIGIKLGHVVWRKLLPSDLRFADDYLNTTCFNLLVKGEYDLAVVLLVFASDILKLHYSQGSKLFFIVNKALAYYLIGDKDTAAKIMKKQDWTASSLIFRLADAVILEEFEKAAEFMKEIGPESSDLPGSSYNEWPLFTEFRKTEIFIETYSEIYGEDFVQDEKRTKNLMDILENIRTTQKDLIDLVKKAKEEELRETPEKDFGDAPEPEEDDDPNEPDWNIPGVVASNVPEESVNDRHESSQGKQ